MRGARFLALACTTVLLCFSGCAVVSVAGSAVSLGVTAGSAAVSVATTVVKGTVAVGGAVVGTVVE